MMLIVQFINFAQLQTLRNLRWKNFKHLVSASHLL